MKKFIVACCCIFVVAALGLYAYFYEGVFIDLDPDKPVETWTVQDGKTIYVNQGDGLEEFEIRGVDLGAGIPGHFATDYAIDKETLSEGLTYGEETPADHLFPDGIPYTDVELNVVRTYDPEKANTLLDEAGWVLNESTGIREKDGQALSLKYTYDSGDALNKSLATAVKSQLAAVGINVETEGQEMMTWWQEGVAGNYDLIMWNTEQPYTSPHNYFIPMLSRSPHVPSLPAVEGSDEFLALIEEFQTTDDSARVQEIFDELLNFDNDNVLDLPLLFVKDMIVYNTDKIAGYDFSSTPMFFDARLIQPAE